MYLDDLANNDTLAELATLLEQRPSLELPSEKINDVSFGEVAQQPVRGMVESEPVILSPLRQRSSTIPAAPSPRSSQMSTVSQSQQTRQTKGPISWRSQSKLLAWPVWTRRMSNPLFLSKQPTTRYLTIGYRPQSYQARILFRVHPAASELRSLSK